MTETTSKPILKVEMLGHFSCTYNGTTLDIDELFSSKLTKVLAYLLYNHQHSIPHSKIIDDLFGEDLENPYGTLKNLVYRIRTLLDKEIKGLDLISTSSGCYAISSEYEVVLDVEEFRQDEKTLSLTTLDTSTREYTYNHAISLYKGDFLPKLSGELWVINQNQSLRTTCLSLIKEYLYLLEAKKDYPAIGKICAKGLELDRLDEEIYFISISALEAQGKTAQAMELYNQAEKLIFNEFGDRPNANMQRLYKELGKSHHGPQENIMLIQDEIQGKTASQGAFVCEYNMFEDLYRVFSRWAQRYGMSIHLALLSVKRKKVSNGPRDELLVNNAMTRLLEALKTNLRQGDVISEYSKSQLLVLLPTCTKETSRLVMDRVLMQYATQGKIPGIEINYTLSPIGIGQQATYGSGKA